MTISTTHAPATDLGYLLHKHPDRLQSFDVSMGVAHVFYPDATEARCTAALLLEVDPIGLVRGRKGPSSEGFALGQYVNDRPYTASSMLAVAMARVFRSAMNGRCDARPELAESALPLEIGIRTLPCGGGPELARRLFGPLGWHVDARTIALDETIPRWGDSRYVDLRLTGRLRLVDALNQLYLLLPVLDDAKHYWISPDEVDKLIRAGGGWLGDHPERDLITQRYLAHRGVLARAALARLAEVDDAAADTFEIDVPAVVADAERARPASSGTARREAVLAQVQAANARRVGDLGCGEGQLVAALLADGAIDEVVAVDVSARVLEHAARNLALDRMSDSRRRRLSIFQSSLTYRDDRLAGLDVAVLMEVIEHVELSRLGALEQAVFGHASPRTVIVTTPNVEHNVRFPALAAGGLRHRDHRFEWTRAEFTTWAAGVGDRYGYAIGILPVGADDPDVGPPTQMAVFDRVDR